MGPPLLYGVNKAVSARVVIDGGDVGRDTNVLAWLAYVGYSEIGINSGVGCVNKPNTVFDRESCKSMKEVSRYNTVVGRQ